MGQGTPPARPRRAGFWERYGCHDYGDPWRIRVETPRAKSFTQRVARWVPHRPGQYCSLRLTAPDGYQAVRSHPVASSPLDAGQIELAVDCLRDGAVSPFMHDVAEVGDEPGGKRPGKLPGLRILGHLRAPPRLFKFDGPGARLREGERLARYCTLQQIGAIMLSALRIA